MFNRMQKLVLGAVAVAMAAFGLVATGTGTAQAVECPYTGCVKTTTTIKAPGVVRKGQTVTVTVSVRALSGVARPKGQVVVKCTRPGAAKTKVVAYRGTPRRASLVLNKVAKWSCSAKFTSPVKFRQSSDSKVVKVVRAA